MAPSRTRVIFVLLAIATLLIAYFGPSAYRKAQMDKEVDRLCAVDGGIKVYERVLLAADQFNQWGDPNVSIAGHSDSVTAPYVVEIQSRDLIKGAPYGFGAPTLSRFSAKIIRRSDRKTLGEAISYLRFGGDPSGPWHPSNYSGCSESGDKNLKKAVFTKSG